MARRSHASAEVNPYEPTMAAAERPLGTPREVTAWRTYLVIHLGVIIGTAVMFSTGAGPPELPDPILGLLSSVLNLSVLLIPGSLLLGTILLFSGRRWLTASVV